MGVRERWWKVGGGGRPASPALTPTHPTCLLHPSGLAGRRRGGGGDVCTQFPGDGGVLHPKVGGATLEVASAAGGPATRVRARVLVCVAGLGAHALARRLAGLPAVAVPREGRAKGSYFDLRGERERAWNGLEGGARGRTPQAPVAHPTPTLPTHPRPAALHPPDLPPPNRLRGPGGARHPGPGGAGAVRAGRAVAAGAVTSCAATGRAGGG